MPKKSASKFNSFLLLLAGSLILNAFLLVRNFAPNLLKTSLSIQTLDNQISAGVVTRIIDGDTLDLKDDTRVRLRNIDAPEYPDGCLAQTAKDRLQALTLGKTITLINPQPGKFDRTIASIFVDDQDIALALVTEGLAKAESNAPSNLLTAQDQAQKAERNIWSSKCQAPPKKGCDIKGNVRRDRGTKVYHLKTCYNYKKIVINEKEKDQWFCSEKAAQAAGFTKSKDCPKTP